MLGVLPFVNLSGNSSNDYFGFLIADHITTAMSGLPGVTLAERARLTKVLEEQEFQLSGVTDDGNATRIGEVLNAQRLLVGSFSLAGGSKRFVINGRLVEVSSSQVVATAEVDGPFGRDVRSIIDLFLYRLLGFSPPPEVLTAYAQLEMPASTVESTAAAKALTARVGELEAKYAATDVAALYKRTEQPRHVRVDAAHFARGLGRLLDGLSALCKRKHESLECRLWT